MNKTRRDLSVLVAQKLSGKQVQIRNQAPATMGCIGEIHCTPKGQLVIDISPDIPDDEKLLHVILHEIAHAKHHRFLESDEVNQKPGSLSQGPKTRGDHWGEETAEKQSQAWQDYGKSHADKRLLKVAPFEAVMLALLTHPGGKK